MRFKNYTREAMLELERQRDTDYNDISEEYALCDNGCASNMLFDAYGKILCRDCIIEEVRSAFSELLSADDSGNASADILADIFSDFSDSEILTYIENRFEKL